MEIQWPRGIQLKLFPTEQKGVVWTCNACLKTIMADKFILAFGKGKKGKYLKM